MTDQPAAHVPPADFQMTRDQYVAYLSGQAILEAAISRLGRDMGLSTTLSGLTREMRRHMSVEDIQRILRGLADTMSEAAAGDLPD